MRCAGLDIGSRTIELVVVEEREIVLKRKTDSGFNPIERAKELLNGTHYDILITTGYGRNLAKDVLGAKSITEIKAYAIGARFLYPSIKAILDIGGQDTKAISLDDNGRIVKFEMNDRCAAGTGRFLEIMAHTLGYSIEEFGDEALKSKREVNINSMCTVFAESEVISLINSGYNRQDIAMGIHRAIAKRNIGMLKRVMREGPILFAGGVAKNKCMVQLIKEALECEVIIPQDPQMIGALGAAIFGEIENNS